ncbi:hypothetical protein RhiTH_007886 [Rhizoctonia solani]
MSFLGDFREGKTLQLDIPRDPHLFRIIQKYLRGYTVLPLSYNQIPLDATRESMMANLREDAVFYQLGGLAYAIDALTLPYVALMKPTMKIVGVANWRAAPIGSELIHRYPFNYLRLPEGASTFDDFYLNAAVQHGLKNELGDHYRTYWKLLGYTSQSDPPVRHQITILVERILYPMA